MVDIRQEGRSQRSAPQRRHTAHLRWRNCEAGTGEAIRRSLPPGESALAKHLGTWAARTLEGHKTPLWSTREPEPEGLSTQPRARLRQFPCRTSWSLSSVDRESIHAVSRGKPSVAQTLRALPTHASDICLQCSSLPTARLNKLA